MLLYFFLILYAQVRLGDGDSLDRAIVNTVFKGLGSEETAEESALLLGHFAALNVGQMESANNMASLVTLLAFGYLRTTDLDLIEKEQLHSETQWSDEELETKRVQNLDRQYKAMQVYPSAFYSRFRISCVRTD